MAGTIKIRARFPDGEVWNLPPLDGGAPLETLLVQIRGHKKWESDPRLVLAGPPPKPLTAEPCTPLQTVIPIPTAVIFVHPHDTHTSDAVTPEKSATARRGRGASKISNAQRGRTKARGHAKANNSAAVTTLADLHPARKKSTKSSVEIADKDDPNDEDWDTGQGTVHSDDESDEISKVRVKRTRSSGQPTRGGQKPSSTGERRSKRTRAAKSTGAVDADGRTLISEGAFEAGREDVGDLSMIATDVGIPHIEGQLGIMLAQSLVDVEGKNDSQVSRELRENFADALKKRQMEAEGERRLSAYLAKRYVITEKSRGVLFSVRYRSVDCRSWTDENNGRNLVTFPKVLLTEVIKSIVSDESNKQKLLPVVMAAVSPRMFWNVARLFPDDMEGGLMQLVPDADWSFLAVRKRVLSVRGKQNEENKKQMGWDSD